MSALKQLGPFIRICQLSGLIPFTMELDSKTGKFHRFRFSWRHYVTWYYLAVWILQVAGFVSMILAGNHYTKSDEFRAGTNSLSIGIIITTFFSAVFNILFFLLTKAITFHHAAIGRAAAFIREVEEHLIELPECKNSVLSRTFFGFCFTQSLVFSYILYNILKLFYSLQDVHVVQFFR